MRVRQTRTCFRQRLYDSIPVFNLDFLGQETQGGKLLVHHVSDEQVLLVPDLHLRVQGHSLPLLLHRARQEM